MKSDNKIYANQGNASIIELINRHQFKNILDIGCGDGSLAKNIKPFVNSISGITISEQEANIALGILDKCYIHNLENGLPEELRNDTFDCIICSHVLEHIAYPDKLLADIKMTLAPEGLLIISVPNILWYKSRLSILMGNFNYTETGLYDYTHVRWYTLKTLQLLLTKSDFKIAETKVNGWVPFYSIFKKFLPEGLLQFGFKCLTLISKKNFWGYEILIVSTH